MRCPDCNKFVSFDDPVADEDDSPEFNDHGDGEGTITGSVRIALPCAECGTELKEATLEYEVDVDHACADGAKVLEDYDEEVDDRYEIVDSDFEATDRYEDTDKHGKKIRNPRYQKHYYGAVVKLTVKCNRCGEEFEIETEVEEQSSNFEEL